MSLNIVPSTIVAQPRPITPANLKIIDKFVKPQIHEEVLQSTATATATAVTPQKKRVVAIAVDDTKESYYAFTWALNNLVDQWRDQVCLLNVRPFAMPGYFINNADFYPSYSLDYNEDYVESVETFNRDESHALLQRYGGELLAKGVQSRGIALRGNPKETLLEKIEELKPDIVVTGTRGKSLFRGSISEYLVQHANTVVIVPKLN
ncbi:hypothetical protein HK100_010993 [Physocladia obscura]|uniref:UspA domain-containing protein n=1 Tax=Physocladia obscura TaxID=109957 RepID=A0AAD5XEG2_9FUNG|nr:hypothetical protein HK100_010993 [Physocladia obscura]